MNRTQTTLPRAMLLLLIAATAVLAVACKARPTPAATDGSITAVKSMKTVPEEGQAFPAIGWAQSTPCGGNPACDRLYVTQGGQVNRLDGANQGFQAQAVPVEKSKWVIDTGSPSPDGQWIAFTSVSYESGGPILLQNTATGQMTNLIEAVNQAKPADQQPLGEDWMWDVIGWFPDSQQLMIGPADMARVDIINIQTYAHQLIPINSEGMSGRAFVDLAPDGSRFVYLGSNAERTEQVLYAYNLTSGETSLVFSQPYEKGIVQFPRYAPDGASVAYLVQEGQPSSGLNFAIDVHNLQTKASDVLVQGNLGLTIPTWSPDGQHIAFTRLDTETPLIAAEGSTAPAEARSNIWVVGVADKQVEQLTFIDGQARSPSWAADGKTLAFVTHDGQVGVTNIDQPGEIWQAAGPSADMPYLTSVFFLP